MKQPAGTPVSGRVTASHGRSAQVEDGQGRSVHCRLYGRGLSVVCGDRVKWVAEAADGAAGLIVKVEPRERQLARLNARGHGELVAANLTQLVAVLAPLPAPDFALLDRYLAAAEWARLKAVIVANKDDLQPEDTALLDRLRMYQALGYAVVRTSKRRAGGADALATLLGGETSVLVGQSGVGKSSLINLLAPGVAARVQEISQATEEGRHTTSVSSLYHLPSGGELIDSPGVRDFAPALPASRDVATGFREIAAAGQGCRFNDCRHLQEPGCQVTAALQSGEIDAARLASYRQLLRLAEERLRK